MKLADSVNEKLALALGLAAIVVQPGFCQDLKHEQNKKPVVSNSTNNDKAKEPAKSNPLTQRPSLGTETTVKPVGEGVNAAPVQSSKHGVYFTPQGDCGKSEPEVYMGSTRTTPSEQAASSSISITPVIPGRSPKKPGFRGHCYTCGRG